MKNTRFNFISLTLFFISISTVSQNLIKDNYKYKATYKQTAQLDSTDSSFVKTENMQLFLGKQTSMFAAEAMSLQHALKIRGNSGNTSRAAVTEFPYIIIKDIANKKRYHTQKIAEDNFYYEESLNDFSWKIHSDTKQYKNYTCTKATANWRGRNYTAWFTKKIPLSNGPYKFNGLPGLIVELYDDKKQYYFELIGFERLPKSLPLNLKFSDYIRVKKEKLKEIWVTYKKDPFTYVNNPNIQISPETHKKYKEAFEANLKKRNNHIEL